MVWQGEQFTLGFRGFSASFLLILVQSLLFCWYPEPWTCLLLLMPVRTEVVLSSHQLEREESGDGCCVSALFANSSRTELH